MLKYFKGGIILDCYVLLRLILLIRINYCILIFENMFKNCELWGNV